MTRFNPRWVMFSSLALELGLSVIVGLLLGSYLDRFFGTGPWMLIVFTASGIAAGYRSVYRLLRRLQQEDAATPLSNDLDPKT
jgi:ATP synthase protein I